MNRILSLWSSRIYLSDYTRVLCIVSSLLLLGLLFVYSSSIFYSERYFGDPHRFFFQQLLFACFGFVLMMIISFIHYSFWKKFSYLLLIFSAMLNDKRKFKNFYWLNAYKMDNPNPSSSSINLATYSWK